MSVSEPKPTTLNHGKFREAILQGEEREAANLLRQSIRIGLLEAMKDTAMKDTVVKDTVVKDTVADRHSRTDHLTKSDRPPGVHDVPRKGHRTLPTNGQTFW
jgi:hypothetical protein